MNKDCKKEIELLEIELKMNQKEWIKKIMHKYKNNLINSGKLEKFDNRFVSKDFGFNIYNEFTKKELLSIIIITPDIVEIIMSYFNNQHYSILKCKWCEEELSNLVDKCKRCKRCYIVVCMKLDCLKKIENGLGNDLCGICKVAVETKAKKKVRRNMIKNFMEYGTYDWDHRAYDDDDDDDNNNNNNEMKMIE